MVTPINHRRSSCPSGKGLVALGDVERRREQDDLSLGTGALAAAVPSCGRP